MFDTLVGKIISPIFGVPLEYLEPLSLYLSFANSSLGIHFVVYS